MNQRCGWGNNKRRCQILLKLVWKQRLCRLKLEKYLLANTKTTKWAWHLPWKYVNKTRQIYHVWCIFNCQDIYILIHSKVNNSFSHITKCFEFKYRAICQGPQCPYLHRWLKCNKWHPVIHCVSTQPYSKYILPIAQRPFRVNMPQSQTTTKALFSSLHQGNPDLITNL